MSVPFVMSYMSSGCDYEENIIFDHCKKKGHPYHMILNEPPKDECIPIGSVEFCEKVYGIITPDYYPLFLSEFLYRKIQTLPYGEVKGLGMFTKPALEYKTWAGTTKSVDVPDETIVHTSPAVTFGDEWRYYILNGNVYASGWYGVSEYDESLEDQEEEEYYESQWDNHSIAPQLPDRMIQLLKQVNYTGLVDMGILESHPLKPLALVEVSHPYGFGWYADRELYPDYMIQVHEYMKNLH